jgi:hypothetical protein
MLITTLSEQLQQDIRENEPARLIEFQGNTYVMPRGTNSFSAVYTVEGNHIKAETNEPEYMCIVLMRKGVDQLEVVEGSFNGVSAGIVLTWETNEHKHMFIGGSCTEPMKCVGCDATKGEPQGHDYVSGTCAVCGAVNENYKAVEDNYWCCSIEPSDEGGLIYYKYARFSDGQVMFWEAAMASMAEMEKTDPEEAAYIRAEESDRIQWINGEEFAHYGSAMVDDGSYTLDSDTLTISGWWAEGAAAIYIRTGDGEFTATYIHEDANEYLPEVLTWMDYKK